jgi:Fe-S-cluster containining protein
MNPACQLCRGACCESIIVDAASLRLPADSVTWLRYHGEPIDATRFELNTPCRFSKDGLCGCYEHRPQPCVVYAPGSKICRETVRRRRENYREILQLLNDPART